MAFLAEATLHQAQLVPAGKLLPLQVIQIRQKVFCHEADREAVRSKRPIQFIQVRRLKAVNPIRSFQIFFHKTPVLRQDRGDDVASVRHKVAVKRQLQISARRCGDCGESDHGLRFQEIFFPAVQINGGLRHRNIEYFSVSHNHSSSFFQGYSRRPQSGSVYILQVNPLYNNMSRQAQKCSKFTHRRRQNGGAYVF